MRNSLGTKVTYIIRLMLREGRRRAGEPASGRATALVLLLLFVASGCTNPFGREYEYEEELYLAVDGSASVVINASEASLIALRGVTLAGAPNARVDAAAVRKIY